MTVPSTNAAGQFGISTLTVSPTPGVGAFSNLTNAVAYAAANGISSLYLYPGTYTVSLAWPAGLAIQGASTGEEVFQVSIVGNQTFNAAGALAFNAISFSAPAGSVWALSNAASTAEFRACSLVSAAGLALSVAGGSVNLFSSALTGNAGCVSVANGSVAGNGSSIDAAGSGDALALGANGGAVLDNCAIIALTGGSNAVTLNAVSSQYASQYGSYAAANAVWNFAAAGMVTSQYETLGASGANYAAGAAGTINLAFASFSAGSSTSAAGGLTVVPFATAGGGVSSIAGNSGGPLSGALSLVGSGGTTVVGSGSTLTITPGPSFTWNAVSVNTAMLVNNGYIATAANLNFTLPAVAAVGSEVAVLGANAGGQSFNVLQNAGQQIFFGNASSTLGAGGLMIAVYQGDYVQLVCTTANTTWYVVGAQGNIIIQ